MWPCPGSPLWTLLTALSTGRGPCSRGPSGSVSSHAGPSRAARGLVRWRRRGGPCPRGMKRVALSATGLTAATQQRGVLCDSCVPPSPSPGLRLQSSAAGQAQGSWKERGDQAELKGRQQAAAEGRAGAETGSQGACRPARTWEVVVVAENQGRVAKALGRSLLWGGGSPPRVLLRGAVPPSPR